MPKSMKDAANEMRQFPEEGEYGEGGSERDTDVKPFKVTSDFFSL
jgi:hypothetical protein